MDTTGTFKRKAGNLKEVGLGWINGGRKDHGFGWGKIRDGGEQLFSRPEGSVGLKRVWEFVPKARKKKRNERVKVSSNS